MDASQYKAYVLTLLFMKYVSDKHANDPNALIEVPVGGFDDMAKFKGDKEIGERINKTISKLAEANNELKGVIDQADFNDESKLGVGKEIQDRLSKLVAIFEGLVRDPQRPPAAYRHCDRTEIPHRHLVGRPSGPILGPAAARRL